MINAKGEWIYTNAEIAYELGLSPATINAIGKRLYGNRIPHWTITEAQRIIEYIKSISVDEDARRLALLREVVATSGYEKQEDEELKEQVRKDLYKVR